MLSSSLDVEVYGKVNKKKQFLVSTPALAQVDGQMMRRVEMRKKLPKTLRKLVKTRKNPKKRWTLKP